jgi:teichoic acid transport system ATP-binding protein
MTESVIVSNVTKRYKMYRNTKEKILDIFFGGHGEDFYALKNISFTAQQGDVIGIIGINGSGKSTLSNIIAGIIPPTTGSIKSYGETSLIAISSGLNNELTGRENIELKCLMLGFSKKEIKKLEPEIIEFSELGDFIDQPVKSYSSGMKSRLGFAISVTVDPDILVIDEALSVGDQTFADKCLEKMNSFKERGKTIFFISHSIAQVKKFCQKALWLEFGEVRAYGTIEEVIPKYTEFLNEYKKMSPEEKKAYRQKKMEKPHLFKDNHGSNTYTGRVSKRNKRHKRKWKKWIITLFIIILLALLTGVAHYLHWFGVSNENGSSENNSHKPITTEKKPVTKTVDKNQHIMEAHKLVVVTKELVNVRSQPSLNGTIIYQGKFGDAFKWLDEQADADNANNKWFHIQLPNGDQGWISSTVAKKVENSSNDHFDALRPLLEERGLPTSVEDLNSLFSQSYDQLSNHFRGSIINTSSQGDNQEIDLEGAQLHFISNHLNAITLLDVSGDAKPLMDGLGEPVTYDDQNLIDLYLFDQIEIKVYNNPANKNEVSKMVLTSIRVPN